MSEVRLIDANALKEELAKSGYDIVAFGGLFYIIDNTPTVDLWQMRQEATENALKKAEVLASIERPQSEWVESHICSCGKILRMEMNVIEHKCKKCGRWSIKWARTIPDSFCSHCGAKIKKGGAE